MTEGRENLSKELPFNKIRNFRELGGYKSSDGRKVKHNVFFRSPGLYQISDKEDIKLFESLGIKTIYDFRSKSEKEEHPDPRFPGITYHEISALYKKDGSEMDFDFREDVMQPHIIKGIFDLLVEGYEIMGINNPAYKQMFKDIVDGNVPLLFHCSAGKDRTGVAAALILSLFGVDKEDIAHDFLATNIYNRKEIQTVEESVKDKLPPETIEYVRKLFGVQIENLNLTFDTIIKTYGSLDRYFEKEFGITPEIRAQLMDRYLE